LSLLDLVHDGNTMQEVVTIAQALEKAGITLLNTGIGWHEARIPTIVTSVPRAAFVTILRK
jgi:2,4-dienoyl-CoA reductase (NADPH2)